MNMNQTTTTTLRAQVQQKLDDMAQEIYERGFEPNYHNLTVKSDGTLYWSEEIDSNTRGESEYSSRKRNYWTLCQKGYGSGEAYNGPLEDVYEMEEADMDEIKLTWAEFLEAQENRLLEHEGNVYKLMHDGEWWRVTKDIRHWSENDTAPDYQPSLEALQKLDEIPIGFFDDEELSEEWEALKD